MKNNTTTFLIVLLCIFTSQALASGEHAHESEGNEHHHEHVDGDNAAHDDNHEQNAQEQHDTDLDGNAHHPSHDEHDGNEEYEHDEEKISHIDSDLAEQVGIETDVAGAQELHQTITVYGALATGPEQLSHVRARFEGMVKSVEVTIGDSVKAGDLLAKVESNESLKTYKILAPISGMLVQRHANTGEVTQDQVLFSIANFEFLWAELRVYPAQQAAVAQEQEVHILINNQVKEAVVNHVIPALDKPYQLARVKLDNSDSQLSPGLLVEARIETSSITAPTAVKKDAVQSLGGREGIFVKHDDEYEFHALVLGRSDDHYVEVLKGIEAGEIYVSENSYLIKADIEKSEAEHDH